MLKMVDPMKLEEYCKQKLEDFLHNVNNKDFVWLDEILEEAIKMFNSSSDGQPEFMPKTPSQKNRRKKKRFSFVQKDQLARKRLSKRESTRSSKRDVENACQRITRSRAASSARASSPLLKKLSNDLTNDRIPLVEISTNERHIAELLIGKTPPHTEKVAVTLISSSEEPSIKQEQPLSKTLCVVVKETPEAKIKEGRAACKLKIANVPSSTTTEIKEPSPQEELCAQHQKDCQLSKMETIQNLKSPQIPTTQKANRHSVRRSLMHSKASLAERYSLSFKREKMIQKSVLKTQSKRKTSQQLSSVSCQIAVEEITESGPKLALTSHEASITAEQQGDDNGGSSEKSNEVQKQPHSARRKPSYKRAVNDQDDGQHSEDDFSPPRKRAPSPQCPASKVALPFKTFLHTVHKNKMLMMTPGSVSRSGTIKSFLKQNTPLRTTPQGGFVEKERQRLENLKKKEEAEQQRKQKLEEEKKRRLDEMRRRREDRLRKVLRARERVEQMEEEKKRRFEQKLAQHEEKNEKMREEKLAEDKAKKKVAAKKLEELEARRKQEEDARKRRALHLEEEERRHKEQMQKKREEEEQEKARKIAEQNQLELEREKQLSAERELEKKREQEKLQAQREQKEKAAQLQKEVIAAAKEKERLRKELEEKERKLQEQKAASEAEAKVADKELNVTVDIENSPACKSYQMTPKGPKQPKIVLNNYGMDLNSDDSTDDESQPRKPIPAWATGNQLSQAIIHQYYKPPDIKALFGVVKSPNLEEIFYKSKPRYCKRTSSAVWNSPPFSGGKTVPYTFKR